MNFVTFEELSHCIYRNIEKIPEDVDLIVGIPRSGTLAGVLLSLYLNLPYVDIDILIQGGRVRSGNTRRCSDWVTDVKDAKHILIVDDSISSGKAIRQVKKELKERNIHKNCTFLAVYALRVNVALVDIYFEICEQPRMFEWNYMHHWALEYTCMDIDGVICDDPGVSERLSEKKYREFLENAKAKIIPTKRVGKLVSGRREKYRKETEAWLKKNGVAYEELFMIPNENNAGDHAAFKADIYKNSDSILFIESSYEQAVRICEITKKQVFCVENGQFITDKNVERNLRNICNNWKITAKRVIKKILRKIDYV